MGNDGEPTGGSATHHRARVVAALPYAAIAGVTIVVFWRLVAAQVARIYFDSAVFLETAQQPWSWSQLFYPKPPVVPSVYGVLGADPDAIVAFQAALAFVAWGALAAALARAVTGRTTRIVAVAVIAAFVLAPTRIGYSHVVLSESINDSLQALWIAAAIVFITAVRADGAGRRAKLSSGVLASLLIAWTWTRDTNAVVVLIAVPLAVVLTRRALRHVRWVVVPSLLVVASAVCVLWSTTVVPPPTGLSVHVAMPEDFTARKTYPTFNNISDRLRDPAAVQYFVDHGMPQADELVRLGAKDQQIYLDPHFTPARRWIVDDASGVYLRWLVRDPIARAGEIVRDAGTFLGMSKQHVYMPTGWSRGTSVIRWLRAATETPLVALALLLAFPLWLRRPRGPLVGLALVLVASGLVGCAASYYGDSLERARHCYAAGQQVIIGLVLAAIAGARGWIGFVRERSPAASLAEQPR